MVENRLMEQLMGDFPPHDVPFCRENAQGASRRLALVLAYCGEGFMGWQVQPGLDTVQGRVEKALGRLCNQPIRVHASGRTDAGVHALGQVAHFETASGLALDRLRAGLQALLKDQVQVRALGPAPDDFHARYSAQAKTYLYYLWPRAKAPVFLKERVWALREALDPEPMARALAGLPGERDLAALASRGSEVKGGTVRRIFQAGLTRDPGGLWLIQVTASGFLRHVVRNLVGVLVQIGRGGLQPGQLFEMLAQGRRIYPGPKAPPGGLYLAKVYYQGPPRPSDLEESP